MKPKIVLMIFHPNNFCDIIIYYTLFKSLMLCEIWGFVPMTEDQLGDDAV
jgi:hypothetical protein